MLGRTVGHYRITDRLGGGGMGVVYRAEDVKLGRTVALKFLPPELTRDPEAKHRFEREAKAASQLDHPNICTVYDFGIEADGQMYLAMACYDGESLASKIEREPVGLDEAIRIVEQIARGLGKAHSAGIVHRDIKPANVMVTSDGVVKILDFGLAKISLASNITKSHTSLGTAAYMAPEQIRGEEVGPQADIWALGIILFELLTGKRPFRGDYAEALSYSILNEQPASLPDEPEIDRIIKRMLRKDPLQRYQTVDEVLADLRGKRAPVEQQRLKSGAKLGPYQIIKPIGSGGMGDVYLASDTRLDRQVAIKVLPPEFSEDAGRKERFKREAKTISQLAHPNICTLFDVGEQEGLDYLVMEFLEGETLAEKKTPLPIPQVLKIGTQIAQGLAAAHKQGIVHRDLKPANVMITKSGAVKLLDFGLAKDAGVISMKGTGSKPLTAEGTIVGTLPYMAPEQIEGKETDARTDIFAFGAILYELTTGKRAFEGETKASLIAAIVSSEPKPLIELQPLTPPALQHVVKKCLSKDPDDRWQSATDMAEELRWIGEAGSQAGVAAPVTLRRKVRDRLTLVIAALLAIALAAIAPLYWRMASSKPPLLHLAISFPPDTAITNQIAVSPDGSRLVMASDGKLWLRSLDSAAATPLTTTDSNQLPLPFWSPDGKFIAFFAGGKLKKIPADGGPVETICDMKSGRGGSWGSDGAILFAPDVFTGLYKVSERGGAPAAVTTLDRQRESTHRWPFFLPDGRHFLYTSISKASDGTDRTTIIAASLDSPHGTPIADNAAYGFYVPSGWLIFARQEAPNSDAAALMAVRFDAGALKTIGRPVALPIEKVQFRWDNKFLACTASKNGLLIYHAWTPPPKAQLRWADAEGKTLESEEQPAAYEGAALSPDGKRIALIRDNDLWIHDAGAPASSRFTFNALDFNAAPRWSPDGNRLYYVAYKTISEIKLFVKSATGAAKEEEIHQGHGLGVGNFDVSPDGRFVLIPEQFPDTGVDIMAIDLATRQARPYVRTSAREYGPAFSPDGKWVVYVGDGHMRVRRFPDSGEQWQVTDQKADYTAEPRWSRDGKSVFYIANGSLMAVPVKLGATFEVGAPRKLFPCDGLAGQSPDGRRFLVFAIEKPNANNLLQAVINWPRMLENK